MGGYAAGIDCGSTFCKAALCSPERLEAVAVEPTGWDIAETGRRVMKKLAAARPDLSLAAPLAATGYGREKIPGADRGASVIPSGGIEYVGGSSSNGNGTVTLTITQVGAKPIIHCELSGNQGTKNRGFAVPYSISDADGDTVTVVEKLDGVVKRTHTPALMEPQECQALLTHDFLALTNGTHELTLEAEDIGATADTVELRFEKNVTSCTITLSEPLPADAMPEAMRLAINGYWTQYAIWTAEVCNNAFDAQPTWEDIKQSILSGYNYPFTNNTKTADKWGINFRISFSRGPSDQGGYIYSIEGGYQ